MNDHVLDLTRYAWKQRHGDIEVIGTWLMHRDGPLACMVLKPASAQTYDRFTPCAVLQKNAWVWSEAIGDGGEAARASYDFAAALGLNQHNATNVFRVASIIRDHIGDLLAIPPMPDERVVVGEATITDERGRVTEREITARV
jgi:hypothetical protein